jgi:thioredoxin-dependent peroxiredoxin
VTLASSARMPEEGQPAPDFELENQDGDPVRLSDLRGQTVVLYFYPRADTPGCTTQACGVRDHTADYEAANAVVLGVSPDEPKRLRRFADKHGLAFTLLGDPDHGVLEEYGVWKERKMYGKTSWGVERTTFVIDADGVVRRVLPRVKPKEHDERVLGILRELDEAPAHG